MSYVTPMEDAEAGRPALSRAMANMSTQDGPVASGMKLPGGGTVGKDEFTPTFVALDGKVEQLAVVLSLLCALARCCYRCLLIACLRFLKASVSIGTGAFEYAGVVMVRDALE